MTVNEILAGILAVDNEEDIKRISTALRERHRSLHKHKAAQNAAALNVGDKVRLVGVSPKYLNGTVGEVIGIVGTKISMILDFDVIGTDSRVSKWSNTTKVPAAAVEKITEAEFSSLPRWNS